MLSKALYFDYPTIQLSPHFIQHLSWDVTNAVSSGLSRDDWVSGEYETIDLHLQLTRREALVETIIVLPALMVQFMSLFAFFLP